MVKTVVWVPQRLARPNAVEPRPQCIAARILTSDFRPVANHHNLITLKLKDNSEKYKNKALTSRYIV
jgi:hypothetical protein